ncbi:MAG: hypothetical protein A2896_01950 [Candidatus Nealsonbacteria bacterium RIFCSPLOWO2_01_FULL_43_32]|uniref:Uncharacterized protein n=1 Tax=Candidatus Nealsonbacteria bacterium RIFCSPLOWO2_01_FULL_43_32 TaxID=1801672 RepID=A0A1G2EFX0_9BACT|nr:MAG: hypothetical protein A2896_01950 [Candidatus Nealsonbacteria bacterium RIFCSPLOWO2_01_FULL_43_32]
MAEINRIIFNTPLGGFSAGFDNIHPHTYPDLHNDNQFGANLNQIDLLTGKKKTIGSFEVNIYPNPFIK